MEDGAKRIVVIVAVLAVAAIGVFWYWQRSKQRALESGNVYVKNESQTAAPSVPPPGSAAMPPEAPARPGAAPVSNASPSTVASPAAATKPSAAVENAAARPSPPAHVSTPPMTQPRGALEVPPSDSIPRNPPSGLIFAGAGKYQLYRQGDITWRLDTDTGRTCIIFATDGQWSRIRVWDSGCGAS